jgi:hypothetical protein
VPWQDLMAEEGLCAQVVLVQSEFVRLSIRLQASGLYALKKANLVPLVKGEEVAADVECKVEGLEGAAHLNGLVGIVQSKGKKGRFAVSLQVPTECAMVLPMVEVLSWPRLKPTAKASVEPVEVDGSKQATALGR